MSPSDEDRLIEAAKHCEDCLCWVEHCKAECCHLFTFYLTPRSDVEYADDYVRIHTPISPDARRYYELHGAKVDGEYLTVPRSACEKAESLLVVRMSCRELTAENLCGLHDAGQPDCCRDFTWETVTQTDWLVTPECLFAYKLKGAPRE